MYREKLLSLGIPASIRGFEYLNYAIAIYKPPAAVMLLYAAVAAHFGVKPGPVERCMRTAVGHSGEEIPVSQFVAKYKILWEDEAKHEV